MRVSVFFCVCLGVRFKNQKEGNMEDLRDYGDDPGYIAPEEYAVPVRDESDKIFDSLEEEG